MYSNEDLSTEQIRKESSDFLREREELNEEVSALKHELVKAEELRTRLESFNSSLEHSLNVANIDNVETKEQIDSLIQACSLFPFNGRREKLN